MPVSAVEIIHEVLLYIGIYTWDSTSQFFICNSRYEYNCTLYNKNKILKEYTWSVPT
jgi:hypothetical protein